MREFRQFFFTFAGAAALAATLIAMPPRIANAQEDAAQSADLTASTPDATVAEPDKAAPPLDIAGCWSGTIEDADSGAGTGAIFFVQHKKKLVKGTGAILSLIPGQASKLGGKVTSTSFVATHHGKDCKAVALAGQLSGSDLTGTYILRRCVGLTTTGTFDFAFDSSGSSCGGR